MRFLLILLTAMCLSLLSFEAAASLQPGPAQAAATSLAAGEAALGVDDFGRIAMDIGATGDSQPADPACAEPPPGFCNIWSADLLDPLDVLDEIEESGALFALPPVRLLLPRETVAQAGNGRASPPPSRFFKPPIGLA